MGDSQVSQKSSSNFKILSARTWHENKFHMKTHKY